MQTSDRGSEPPASQSGDGDIAAATPLPAELALDSRRILYEAVAGGALVLSISLLIEAAPAERWWPAHPGWLVVLLLAARYGNRGLLAGVASAGLAAGLALVVTGAELGSLTARMSSGDLGAALAAILVSWVASAHHERSRGLAVQLARSTARTHDSEQAVTRLTEAAIALRGRVERTEGSLSFLSDIARRIDLGEPSDGAEAALQLAIAPTGARAGLVQIVENGRLRTLASHGAWSLDSLEPPALHRDRTAYAAVERAQPVRAYEVDDVRPDDSDLAAPIIRSDGVITGMIALRGVPFAAMKAASLSDLDVVARWLSRTLDGASAGGAASSQRNADAR